MPIPILMPALSPTMEEGTLAKWHVKEGDAVASGDVIAEIETDKATMEVEAVDEGIVGRILIEAGTEGVAVNKPIMMLLEEGEGREALENMPEEATIAQPPQIQGSTEVTSTAGTTKTDVKPNGRNHDKSRTFASPLARRVAARSNIDIATIKGSGPRGRVIKSDIENALKNGMQSQSGGADTRAMTIPAAMPDDKVMAVYEPGSYEIVPHDNMRKTIARRLVEAKTTIPHFYLSIECRLDELLAARKRMNEAADGRYKLSVNDFIIKAMGLALQEAPGANATWTEQGILRHTRSDVGVAVAVEGGLFTPVIRHADLKTLSEISNEMKSLASRARERKLKPQEYLGGTTSISNLGMMGIKRFDAVINPPHATILAVGAGEERIIAENGAPVAAMMMSCTLSCDHRVVDGVLGAMLLGAFKRFIEDPVRMLV